MIEQGVRICDICRSRIPKGSVYRLARLPREGGMMLLSAGSRLAPSWMDHPDGTISLDICGACTLAMGSPAADSLRN